MGEGIFNNIFYENGSEKNFGTTIMKMRKPNKDKIRELEKYLIGMLRNVDRLVITNFQKLN